MNMTEHPASVDDMVDVILPAIVELASPVRVVLFGSAANGKLAPGSDLDFLVVVKAGRKIGSVADRLNTGIRNRPVPCDFVVTTSASLRKHGRDRGSVYKHALETGKQIYAGI